MLVTLPGMMLEREWKVLGVYTMRAAPVVGSAYQWAVCTVSFVSPTMVAKLEKFSLSW